MNNKIADKLLIKTLEDYNLIGYDFSSKRAYITQDILDLKKFTSPNDKILDLGCGNGRLCEIFDGMNVDYLGVDISPKMIEIAQQKYPKFKFKQIDFFHLPYPDNYFDTIYCLSVLHHIPSKQYRRKFIKEAKRTLKPEGKLILTVWNLLGKKEIIFSIVKNTFSKLFFQNSMDFKDILLPFKKSQHENMTDRYLHCFTLNELKSILNASGLHVKESGILNRGKKVRNENLYTISTKIL